MNIFIYVVLSCWYNVTTRFQLCINTAPNKQIINPKELLQQSANDDRRQHKVNVVTRLLDALRVDQTGLSKSDVEEDGQSAVEFIGRMHGCVGSHWELLPPVYAPPSSNTNDGDASTVDISNGGTGEEDFKVAPTQIETKFDPPSPPNAGSATPDAEREGEDTTPTIASNPTKPPKIYPLLRGGGIRLPGLDWNKTFRKGYAVLVWVRPTLDCPQTTIPDGAVPRKQVLYRFATSPGDNVNGSVGVCAVLGQWSAVSTNEEVSQPSRTMLTTTVTAFTLPNANPIAHLVATKSLRSSMTERGGSSSKSKSAESNISFKGGSAHARNMEHFQKHQSHNPAVTNKGRLANKAVKAAKSVSNHASRKKQDTGVDSIPTSPTGEYISAQLTLPADEWSLVGIQHTHPYLRRPELTISVNGEEMLKGELGYPLLDGVVDDGADFGGLSALSLSGSTSPTSRLGSASNDVGMVSYGSEFLDDSERLMLRRRGILAECTLLDGAFENGVTVSSKQESSNNNSAMATCVLSVHSMVLLSGLVPNAVLAMIAERGPMGDSASGSGLSFVLGPVPPNPQNRDAVVALSAGHGYYGSGGGNSSSSSSGGIVGGTSGVQGELVPPRTLGIPVSVGITPGVTSTKVGGSTNGSSSGKGSSDPLGDGETWIGGGEEHVAHVCLQGLISRAALTFHAGDTRSLGGYPDDPVRKGRIVCPPSPASSCIGGADAVPKVGIVRPTPPVPNETNEGLEITGNSRYRNVTLTYIELENRRQSDISFTAVGSDKYDDSPPVSFPRALCAANAMHFALLPFRLALPRAGTEEVNDVQRSLHAESYSHLCDIISNDGRLAGLLIDFIAECILCGGSTLRDDALQNGVVHVLVNLTRKVLIRGARLGLLPGRADGSVAHREQMSPNGKDKKDRENVDYDQDHDSSCPPVIPSAISRALVRLIDVCCGPLANTTMQTRQLEQSAIIDPCRGAIRVRRASDVGLTALFGLAMDFDLLGSDAVAAAPILRSIALRYCQISSDLEYGVLLRRQMNLQYFLDTIRVRFDRSVKKGSLSDEERSSLESIAMSLSDILYSMLFTTLTSVSGTSVTRGERDVGALVATLTECPFGSVCAHVVTSAIAKLLVKCGVLSPLSMETQDGIKPVKSKNSRRRDPANIALESRLARNMLLCHYHDIVAPLLLSRSVPRYSSQKIADNEEKDEQLILTHHVDAATINASRHPMDWTNHWRLSFLTFVWLTSLAGLEESQSTSTSTGQLLFASAKAGSLDGAMFGATDALRIRSNMLTTLSQFLVLNSSGEKDNR